MVQSGPISNVPLDGSAQVTVPYPLGSFAAYVQGVAPSYTPPTETDYQISFQVLPIAPATTVNNSLSGFILVATGGPPGSTGQCSFVAQGI